MGEMVGVGIRLTDEPPRADAFDQSVAGMPDLAAPFAVFLMTQVQAQLQRVERTWPELVDAMPVLLRICGKWRGGQLSNKMLADLLQTGFADLTQPLATALTGAESQAGAVLSDDAALEPVVDAILADVRALIAALPN